MELENKKAEKEDFGADPVTQDKFVSEHEFDGIRELGNDPPFWLSLVFVVTVLFAYAYLANYHIFKSGDLSGDEYENEMAKYNPSEEEADVLTVAPVAEVAITPLIDPASIASGKVIFTQNCTVCHLSKGEGLVGPNLTDEYWINGGGFKDIVNTISNGVPEKGMISWKLQISKAQILQVASYIKTLQGTNPPNQKAPQGEKYVAEK
jgi:cytochrome c oxidase cbb3-type subunit 3